MNGDFKVRGPDERTHIFRLEAPGKYQHYSRPVWEKYALERLEDGGRYFTLTEVRDYIDSLSGGGPITSEEVKWVHDKVKNGVPDKTESGIDVLWDQETEEPKADPNRRKTPPAWQCTECKVWFGDEAVNAVTLSFLPGKFCKPCRDRIISEFRGGFGGYSPS